MKIIFDYNRTLFDPETDALRPGVVVLLRRLSPAHRLFLVSRNEAARQTRFEILGIRPFFQGVFFVDEKSRALFQDIVLDDSSTVIVGDSISDEITLGNQLGLVTVRLKQGKFATQVPQTSDEQAQFEIFDLCELEKILLQL